MPLASRHFFSRKKCYFYTPFLFSFQRFAGFFMAVSVTLIVAGTGRLVGRLKWLALLMVLRVGMFHNTFMTNGK